MITIISGFPGVGKTLFLTNLVAEQMINKGLEDYLNLKRELKQMSNGGMVFNLPPQHHLVFSDYPVKINRHLHTYEISGFDIGLPNPFFKTKVIPPYSTIFLDEAQRYYDSRFSKYLREDVYRWFQLHRHNDYNIFMSCQRLANIDVNIRAIAENCIVIDSVEFKKNNYGQVKKIVWKMRKFHSCDSAETYMLAREKNKNSDIGEKFEVVSKLPITNFYNTKSCKPVFYNNKYTEGFDYFYDGDYVFTLDSFIEFNNKHYFVAPVGYLKNTKYDEKILKEQGGFVL